MNTSASSASQARYARFADFYPFYLSKHDSRIYHRLRRIGTSWVLLSLALIGRIQF